MVISLSSYEAARSITELSESPLFHHQYSSIRDGITGVGADEATQQQTMQQARQICLSEIDFSTSDRILLQTDASSIVKPHSACLEDRQYVKINNNVIAQNAPISVGYPISLVNWSAGVGKWSVPIDIRRIPSDQSATDCAVEQMHDLLKESPFRDLLVINTLDTGYGNTAYLGAVWENINLVNLARFRYGKKVWLQSMEILQTQASSTARGAPRVYGEKFYLTDQSGTKTYHRKGVAYQVKQQSIFDLDHQDYIELTGMTSKGRALNIQVWRWNDLLIRSKNGQDMKDKPFDLIASRVSDQQTGELVFQRTMFTAISGQQKAEITTQQAFEGYRKRYDIEPSIKFAKQKLLLDKYQTSCKQHFENWLVVVMMSFWLLFIAKDEVEYSPKKWRQYKEAKSTPQSKNDTTSTTLTPNQVRQAAQDLFLTFETTPFLPKTSNKGTGRKKNIKLTKRIRCPVVKKSKDKTIIKLKSEQLK